ncbi:MAG: hypothetical protein WC967_13430 [Balneolaceae bacterium]
MDNVIQQIGDAGCYSHKYVPRQKGISYYKPATLYYLKFVYGKKVYYKLGITTKTIEERIKGLKVPLFIQVNVIATSSVQPFIVLYNIEQNLHRLFKEDRAKGITFIVSGRTEVYKRDILGLAS